jgi:ligand-binding sensor domain-containing protein/serine phosphatase RsbU (regulator of sigma subunit)
MQSSVQAQSYPFVNYTVEDGLSNSIILSVEQADNGEMWFGTNNDGISIFDGFNFRYLTTEDSLIDNVVFAIEKDEDGLLWIGTNSGLSIYDGSQFTNYGVSDGLTHSRIFHVFFREPNVTWLATGQGVTVVEDGVFKPYEGDSLLNNSVVVNINFDDDGTIWFCTLGNGLIKHVPGIDGAKGTYTQYSFGNTADLITEYCYGVCRIGVDHYWVLTNRGLIEWKGAGMQRMDFEFLDNDQVYCYNWTRDHEGSIWIVTSAGVIKYRKEEFSHFSTDRGLVNNNIMKLLQDREGNMWFASRENGVSKLVSERFYLLDEKDGLSEKTVQCIFREENGTLWLGTKDGVTVYQGDQVINHLMPSEVLNTDEVWSINQSKEDDMWLGTNAGLAIWDGQQMAFYDKCEVQGQKWIYDILFDRQTDQNYLATRAGVSSLEGDSLVDKNDFFGLSGEPVFQFHQGRDGNIWIAAESGLFRYDGSETYHFTEADGFVTEKVRSVIEDEHGNLWMATSSGIYRRNKEGVFSNISERDGLSSNTIYSLRFDYRGNLWAGVTNGIDKVVFRGNDAMTIIEVRHYGPEDGFLGQVCNNNALAVDDHSNVLIGTIKGLMVYQPEYDRKNEKESLMMLRNVHLFSLQTDWRDYADSVSASGLPVNLELPYNKNYFTFEFVGVSHTAPEKVRYKYMLQGFDKHWRSSTDESEAVYSNLPFGTYEFMVMAENGEGKWNKDPVTFSFTVHPPFWRTWWFYALCFIAFTAAVWSYLSIRNANKKITQQNNEIVAKSEEIQQALGVIEEKNGDIMASIKYAKRIQDAILPSHELIELYLPDSFVLYLPKDIVSGDFYWVQEKDGKILFAAVDCTGHGVPGAFVSIVGHNHLNAALKEAGFIKPGNILNYLNQEVTKTLHQKFEKTTVRDGMDLALCSFDPETLQMQYAGANNPLYIIRNGELIETKATKRAIGSPYGEEQMATYTNHEVELQKGDAVYIFSDGYADQFGGPKGKKFKYRQFKDLLVSMQSENMQKQKEMLHDVLKQWMQDHEQIDDICIIGMRV